MANIKFSELASAASLDKDDVLALSHEQGGGWTSLKTTVEDLGNKIVDDITYADLTSTDKKIVGAINEKVDWKSNGVLGAKNLNSYPYYHTSRNASGIDWTDNGDGTWTAKGLATSNSGAYCHNRVHPSDRELFLPNGDYIVCGCQSGGSASTYSINIDITTNGSNNNLARDYGDGATFTISGDDYSNDGAYVRVSCTVYSGYDCGTTDGIIFKPMILLDEDTDYTWRPYAMTNKELTDVVNNVPTTAGTYTLQAVRNADSTITYSWV